MLPISHHVQVREDERRRSSDGRRGAREPSGRPAESVNFREPPSLLTSQLERELQWY